MKILAIETSCDETAASVVEDGTKIISNVVASSTEMHKKYGGIVPEIAAREQLKCIVPVITEALSPLSQNSSATDSSIIRIIELSTQSNSKKTLALSPMRQIIENSIDAIAVTVGPGLIGSLLIGVETAKTIAFVTGKPIIPVNHVLAHMYANFISDQQSANSNQPIKKKLTAESGKLIAFPAISLVVSGGHTELFLMTSEKKLTWLGGTLDDAAGEAFDKTARLLGFENRGGPAIAAAAERSSPSYSSSESSSTNREVINNRSRRSLPREFSPRGSNNITLPRPMMYDKSFNFSFSGLKTAILREVNKLKENKEFNDITISQLADEVQEAITDVLVAKTIKAAQLHNAKSILISGGVSANLRLREKFLEAISYQLSAISFFAPYPSLCTDNAAYIASYAYFRGKSIDWHDITAAPDLSVEISS